MIFSSLLSFKHVLTNFVCLDAKGKKFKLDIKVMHLKDLNFVLRSKIFVNFDE